MKFVGELIVGGVDHSHREVISVFCEGERENFWENKKKSVAKDEGAIEDKVDPIPSLVDISTYFIGLSIAFYIVALSEARCSARKFELTGVDILSIRAFLEHLVLFCINGNDSLFSNCQSQIDRARGGDVSVHIVNSARHRIIGVPINVVTIRAATSDRGGLFDCELG